MRYWPRPGAEAGIAKLAPSRRGDYHSIYRNFLLKPERPSVAALHRRIFAECQSVALKPPSYNSIRARIDAFDIERVVHRRLGAKAARDRFRLVQPEGLRPDRPLHLYQIDHTPVDVIVVDEMDRLPIGRPWLTLVIDVASRMIAGFHLSFEHPSSTSVALAISHAVLPKKNIFAVLEWMENGLLAAFQPSFI